MENYFKRALEILWEEDREGNDYLRQLRFLDIPLEVRAAAVEKISLLLKEQPRYYSHQGKIIFRGIACGSAAHLKPGQDLRLFPEGGILVAREWCPEWSLLVPKTAAILIEQMASPSLAFLARSLRIPAISQLPGLTEKIPDHTFITVDAEDNVIYENRVEPLLDAQLLEGHRLEDEPEYLLLDGVLRAIDHSYLTGEVGAPPGALEGCRTLLEGIQWARRQAMAVLFDPATWQHLVRDQWALPVAGENHFSIYAIDLDKALAGSKPAAPLQAAIHRAEISSTPWCSIRQNLNNLPFFERTVANQEETPIFLIFTENTLFLFQSSAAGKFIIDAAITGVPELNHLFFYREESEQEAKPGTSRPGESRASGVNDKTSIYERRSFGKSDFDTKEQLKRSELRLDREPKNNPR
jgi:phosphohistidine swiveling domain-containing protein